MSLLIDRNDKLEEEVQALRARLTSIEESLDEQRVRITNVEDKVHDATDAIAGLKIHGVSGGEVLDEGRTDAEVTCGAEDEGPEVHPAQSRKGFERELSKWMAWTESLNRRVSILEACEDEEDWVDDI